MSALVEVADRFAHLTASVLPWLAIGLLAAAAIRAFVPAELAGRLLGGRAGLPVAIAAGALLPGCSRTTIPLAMGLRGFAGQRLGTLTALVFVAPLLSPITVALTWSMLGWRMAAARVIAAIAGSAAIGLLINRFERWFEAPRRLRPIAGGAPTQDECCVDEDDAREDGNRHAVAAARRLVDETLALGRTVLPYFLAGMVLAAVVTALLPEDAIPDLIGGAGGPLAFMLAAVLGAPIYVCQGEEVPLTYAVLASGVGPGPSLTFLLGSVGMCLPTVVMSRAVLAPRVTAFYVAFWTAWVVLAGAAFHLVSA